MNKNKFISRNNLIIFCDNFNEPINDYIDIINNHTTIFFGISFNNDISLLPSNITTIIFDSDSHFNQEIKDFPYNIKKILFGDEFTKSLDFFSESLEEIEFYFTSKFDLDLSNLPISVKKITLGNLYSKSLNYLPPNLEYLKLSSNYNQDIKYLPPKLKHLYFEKAINYGTISSNLIQQFYKYEIVNLPNNLIEITFPKKYKYPIENIPKSLKILRIDEDYEFIEKLKKEYPNVKIYYNKN